MSLFSKVKNLTSTVVTTGTKLTVAALGGIATRVVAPTVVAPAARKATEVAMNAVIPAAKGYFEGLARQATIRMTVEHVGHQAFNLAASPAMGFAGAAATAAVVKGATTLAQYGLHQAKNRSFLNGVKAAAKERDVIVDTFEMTDDGDGFELDFNKVKLD